MRELDTMLIYFLFSIGVVPCFYPLFRFEECFGALCSLS